MSVVEKKIVKNRLSGFWNIFSEDLDMELATFAESDFRVDAGFVGFRNLCSNRYLRYWYFSI